MIEETLENNSALVKPSRKVEYLVMEPKRNIRSILSIKELWHYRELFVFLALRDIKIRYKQALLGAGWAVIQPILSMIVFTVCFGWFAKIPSDGVHYSIFSFIGMLPWTYFTAALARGSNSLVGNGTLLSKVYFPRIIIPTAAVLGVLIDFLISFSVLLVILPFYKIYPTLEWVALIPLLILMNVMFALGLSLWLSALNIQYRDVSHIIPFFIQLGLYATPIVYPLSMVPEKYKWLVRLNPMTGIIEGFRVLFPMATVDYPSLFISIGVILFISATGTIYFSKIERSFADIL